MIHKLDVYKVMSGINEVQLGMFKYQNRDMTLIRRLKNAKEK